MKGFKTKLTFEECDMLTEILDRAEEKEHINVEEYQIFTQIVEKFNWNKIRKHFGHNKANGGE